MAAGIPGGGVGGLFYIINSLLLPFHGLWLLLRGERVEWRPLLRQAALGIGVVAGIFLSGWIISEFIRPPGHPAAGPGAVGETVRILGIGAIYLSLITLAVILVAVQVARYTTRRPR